VEVCHVRHPFVGQVFHRGWRSLGHHRPEAADAARAAASPSARHRYARAAPSRYPEIPQHRFHGCVAAAAASRGVNAFACLHEFDQVTERDVSSSRCSPRPRRKRVEMWCAGRPVICSTFAPSTRRARPL
jgi:hypothetical protein